MSHRVLPLSRNRPDPTALQPQAPDGLQRRPQARLGDHEPEADDDETISCRPKSEGDRSRARTRNVPAEITLRSAWVMPSHLRPTMLRARRLGRPPAALDGSVTDGRWR
jgi:hypothetical protein